MEPWIEFWKWAFIIMLGVFYGIVLVILPLGARDLLRLFHLRGKNNDESE